MIRQIELTVNPATPVSAPTSSVVKLGPGILDTVTIRPPPGPNWEVYTRIVHLENAIIPDSNVEWIPLERETLIFPVHFTEWKEVYKVRIDLCAPQARFPHTIQYELVLLEYDTLEVLLTKFIEKGF